MSKTKVELAEQLEVLEAENAELRDNADQRITEENETLQEDVDELKESNAALQAQIDAGLGDPEDIPQHGHSQHESRAERQNRLRAGHIQAQLETLAP